MLGEHVRALPWEAGLRARRGARPRDVHAETRRRADARPAPPARTRPKPLAQTLPPEAKGDYEPGRSSSRTATSDLAGSSSRRPAIRHVRDARLLWNVAVCQKQRAALRQGARDARAVPARRRRSPPRPAIAATPRSSRKAIPPFTSAATFHVSEDGADDSGSTTSCSARRRSRDRPRWTSARARSGRRRTGSASSRRRIAVGGMATVTIEVAMERQSGHLDLRVASNASVVIDGKEIGKGPTVNVNLPVGGHRPRDGARDAAVPGRPRRSRTGEPARSTCRSSAHRSRRRRCASRVGCRTPGARRSGGWARGVRRTTRRSRRRRWARAAGASRRGGPWRTSPTPSRRASTPRVSRSRGATRGAPRSTRRSEVTRASRGCSRAPSLLRRKPRGEPDDGDRSRHRDAERDLLELWQLLPARHGDHGDNRQRRRDDDRADDHRGPRGALAHAPRRPPLPEGVNRRRGAHRNELPSGATGASSLSIATLGVRPGARLPLFFGAISVGVALDAGLYFFSPTNLGPSRSNAYFDDGVWAAIDVKPVCDWADPRGHRERQRRLLRAQRQYRDGDEHMGARRVRAERGVRARPRRRLQNRIALSIEDGAIPSRGRSRASTRCSARCTIGVVSDHQAPPVRPSSQLRTATPDGSESRAYKRLPVEIEVEIVTDDGIESGRSLNISTGGIFVATAVSRPAGTRLEIRLVLPDDGEPTTISTEVRWSRPKSSGGEAVGMGLRFVDVPEPILEKIAQLAQERRSLRTRRSTADASRGPEALSGSQPRRRTARQSGEAFPDCRFESRDVRIGR